MKKYLFFAAAGLCLFSACSNDEDPILKEGGNEGTAEQTIVLKVASTGDNFIETRAGRPLYSSEANQTIDKVKIVIYSDGNKSIKAVKEINNWSTDAVSDIYKTNGHGRESSWTLKGDDKLDPGTYKVIAVGYTNAGDYATSLSAFNSYTKDGTITLPLTASIASDATAAEEIFAGEISEITVGADGAFDLTTNATNNVLTLHRQVAGTFGYFTGIPAKDVNGTTDAATLRLVSSNINTKLFMNNFNSGFKTTGTDVKYIVNGTTASSATKVKFSDGKDGFTVYSIALNEWFNGTSMDDKNSKDEATGDGILDSHDTWKQAISATNGTPEFARGSVFGGSFLIPFVASTEANTFELQLVATDGTILRHWNIKLASNDAQYTTNENANQVSVVNGANGSYANNTANEALDKYSVVRNHLYTIGKRTLDKPEAPGTDPDEPVDLSKAQDIIIKVNDNWEVLHELVVD